MTTDGLIDLWQQGTSFIAVTQNGPFGLSTTYFEGTADELNALLDAFQTFGQG